MSLIINICYTGENENAKNFAQEMVSRGIVDRIRNEEGNIRYEYFFPMDDSKSVLLIDEWVNEEALDIHHKSLVMQEIAQLREKYGLKMRVKKYKEWESSDGI